MDSIRPDGRRLVFFELLSEPNRPFRIKSIKIACVTLSADVVHLKFLSHDISYTCTFIQTLKLISPPRLTYHNYHTITFTLFDLKSLDIMIRRRRHFNRHLDDVSYQLRHLNIRFRKKKSILPSPWLLCLVSESVTCVLPFSWAHC